MNNQQTKPTATAERKPDLVKKIGKTTYKVNVHFNPKARETMSDKIIRMLRNEIAQAPKI